jgi:hypothetical protein
MSQTTNLKILVKYLMMYFKDFSKLTNNHLGGFKKNPHKPYYEEIKQFMIDFTKEDKYSLNCDNLADTLTYLFNNSDETLLNIQHYAILDHLLHKKSFGNLANIPENARKDLKIVYDSLSTKYNDSLVSFDPTNLDDKESSDSETDGETISSKSPPRVIDPSPTDSSISSITSTAVPTTLTPVEFFNSLFTSFKISFMEENEKFKTEILNSVKEIKDKNQLSTFNANELEKYDLKLLNLYKKIIKKKNEIKNYQTHLDQNTVPHKLDYNKFPLPVLPHDSRFVDRYNDKLCSIQKDLMKFIITYLDEEIEELENEILFTKRFLKEQLKEVDKYMKAIIQKAENQMKSRLLKSDTKLKNIIIHKYVPLERRTHSNRKELAENDISSDSDSSTSKDTQKNVKIDDNKNNTTKSNNISSNEPTQDNNNYSLNYAQINPIRELPTTFSNPPISLPQILPYLTNIPQQQQCFMPQQLPSLYPQQHQQITPMYANQQQYQQLYSSNNQELNDGQSAIRNFTNIRGRGNYRGINRGRGRINYRSRGRGRSNARRTNNNDQNFQSVPQNNQQQ